VQFRHAGLGMHRLNLVYPRRIGALAWHIIGLENGYRTYQLTFVNLDSKELAFCD
jgi:hypothetical protein